MASFWKRLFGFRKKGPAGPPPVPPTEQLAEAVLRLRNKLKRFLVTRSVESGVVAKHGEFTIRRNNSGLFRLDGPQVSVLINTAPFLQIKDGQLQGLIRMGEADLCRAIAVGKGAEEYFRHAEALDGSSAAALAQVLPAAVGRNEVLPALTELLQWTDFEIQQLVAISAPNTLAHVLVHAPSEVYDALVRNLSRRKQQLLASELETLGGVGARPELNPHSRLRPLTDFEPALLEFRRSMLELRANTRRARTRAALE